MCMLICVYVCACVYVCVRVCVWRERERQRQRQTDRDRDGDTETDRQTESEREACMCGAGGVEGGGVDEWREYYHVCKCALQLRTSSPYLVHCKLYSSQKDNDPIKPSSGLISHPAFVFNKMQE